MAKWLYAGGKLYNTDCFQRIECRRIKSKPEVVGQYVPTISIVPIT